MISSLKLTNFRSYDQAHITFHPSITIIEGPNATGKTNLLEAIFVMATTKSFRAKDAELICHGQDFYRIELLLQDKKLALGYQKNQNGAQKRAFLDGAKQSLVQHLNHMQVVLFEPNDLQLVLGSPDRRRRYLDFILTQTNPRYLQTLHQYRRVLQQRNSLLANWSGNQGELFAWNIKLAELAADIDAGRREVIGHINTLAKELYRDIAGTAEDLSLSYIGTVEQDDYPTRFTALLEQNLSRDIGAGFTTIGPHRDDFDISFKHNDITSVASRGEMRTVVLVLKLAELKYIQQQTERPPILLLDDVFSELDESRRNYLIHALKGKQVVITTTDGDMARQFHDAKIIKSGEGEL